ncbi:MAG: hypothetical protein J0L72_04290 [Armatimonadetes bacterium]|nr:hypothetical protein [Armatimonadota bacterium]
MLISDAKKYIGKIVDLEYVDRAGATHVDRTEVFDVTFIALYGPCMITDLGDIRLDRVSNVTLVTEQLSA